MYCTLASSPHCGLYGRDLDMLPLDSQDRSSSASSSRNFMTDAVRTELDAIKFHGGGHWEVLYVGGIGRMPKHQSRTGQ